MLLSRLLKWLLTYYRKNDISTSLVDKNSTLNLHTNLSRNFQVLSQATTLLVLFIYQILLTKSEHKKQRRIVLEMERQKSMEKGLLNKSLSIRERECKFPNEDIFLETGLSRKSPRDVIKKAQDDDGECRVTASVFLSTFVAVSGSFCSGCGVSHRFHTRFNHNPSGFDCLSEFHLLL